jgi:phytoene synthase
LPVGDPAALVRREHRVALAVVAARLVDAAEPYYRSSVTGIATLPFRSAWSIATARGVYRRIGHLVRARGAAAWDERAATSRWDKLRFIARGGAVALLSRVLPARSRASVRTRTDAAGRAPSARSSVAPARPAAAS